MCAIAGIFYFDDSTGRVDRDELLRMRDRMSNRGPDGAGEWYTDDRKLGLAHRRLAIIDLSEAGAQPMVSSQLRSSNGECRMVNLDQERRAASGGQGGKGEVRMPKGEWRTGENGSEKF